MFYINFWSFKANLVVGPPLDYELSAKFRNFRYFRSIYIFGSFGQFLVSKGHDNEDCGLGGICQRILGLGMFGKIVYCAVLTYFNTNRGLSGQIY